MLSTVIHKEINRDNINYMLAIYGNHKYNQSII